jgi:hypothetical protein
MSVEKHNSGRGPHGAPFHESVTFEPRDINVGTVVKQLIYLGITILLALAICVPILKFLTNMAAESDTPMAPVRANINMQDCNTRDAYPPEPRLQGVPCHETDAQQDLREKNAADMQENESTHWVDQSSGIAKIPVKDAMKIIAEKDGAVATSGAPAQEKKK